jgi:hypothetical protein
MGKKKTFKLKENLFKVMEEFCISREMDMDDFVEAAILEKLEVEDLKDEIAVYDKPYEEYNLSLSRDDIKIAEPKKGKMN